jgi:chitodextrinase
MSNPSVVKTASFVARVRLFTCSSILCAILLISFNTAHAATPAFVKLKEASAITNTNNITTGNFASAVTNGNLLVTWIWYNSTTQSVSSVTDTKGNVYVKAVGPTTGTGSLAGWRQEIWYAKNVVGGTGLNVTATFTGIFNAEKAVTAHEYSGVDTVSPLDVAAAAVTSSANASSGSVTTHFTNELIFGAGLFASAGSQGSGFTIRSTIAANASEDKLGAAIGSYAATFTNSAQSAIAQMVTFKPLGAVPDTQPPTTPTGLVATPVSSSQINLAWASSTDNVAVTGYKVYRNSVQIATTTTATYQNTGLLASTSYSYNITAFDAASNVSALSATATATTLPPPDTTPPSVPTNLQVSNVGTSSLALSWASSTDNVAVSGYQVFRNSLQIATSLLANYRDTNLAPSTTYAYTISAFDAAGNISAQSASVSTTTLFAPDTTPPSVPTNVVATPISSSQINLTWATSTDNVAVTGYGVYRNGVQITNVPMPGYSDTGLLASTSYSYNITAFDAARNVSAKSSTTSATTLSPTTLSVIAVSPANSIISTGGTQQFIATGQYSDGSFQNITTQVTWSSLDTTVATVSNIAGTQGLATAGTNVGSTTIIATLNSIAGSAHVTVTTTSGFSGVFTWHNDNVHTGANLSETILTPANVRQSTFGKLFSYPVDGQLYTQPLYVPNVAIPGMGTFNVVYVATQHDSVYAFDADGLATTSLWHVSFVNGTTVTTVPSADTGECCDIAPEIGITSTPVIDPLTGTIYVEAKTKEIATTTSYVQRLHALDITTGTEKFGGPVVIQAVVNGTGDGNDGAGHVPFLSLRQLQREALTLSNGIVYLAFASHGDNVPYHGWVLGYNASNLAQAMVFNDTPNGGYGGIWQSGAGPAIDQNGAIYFVTGNGTFSANTGGIDYGDSVMKISPAGTVLDYFTPYNQATISAADLDLGSTGEILLPDQPGAHTHLLVTSAKNGAIYLIDRDNMGHFNSANDNQIVQVIRNAFPNGSITQGAFASPVFWNNKVYFGAVGDVLRVFSLNNGLLSTTPVMQTASTYGYPGAMLSISANSSTNGILWAVQRNGASSPAVLHAYDASNLTELYNTSQASGGRDQLDIAVKFVSPTIAAGKVYVVGNGSLAVLGLLPGDITPPSVPTNLSAAPASASQINLTWTASTDNVGVSGYRVYRNGFTIATSTVTNFSDTGLSSQTAYTYTVDAFDSAGNYSAQSVAVTATTSIIDTLAPSVPTGLQASNITSSSLLLAWASSTDNVAVAGYQVFRNSLQIATSTATLYADSGLTASTSYTYAVTAFDASGNISTSSSPFTVTTASTTNYATPAFVQLSEINVNANSSTASSPSFTATAGNLLTVWLWYNLSTANVTAVTDAAGDSFSKAAGPSRGAGGLSGWSQEIWYASNVKGGSSQVTATFSSAFSGEKAVSVNEYSGLDKISPLEAGTGTIGTTANAATPSVNATIPKELIYGAGLFLNNGSAGSGFSQRSALNANVTEDKNVTSTGSYSASFTNSAQDWIAQMATFRAAGQ